MHILSELIRKNNYHNNYSKQLFSEAVKRLFYFFLYSEQIFCQVYINIILNFSLIRPAVFCIFVLVDVKWLIMNKVQTVINL